MASEPARPKVAGLRVHGVGLRSSPACVTAEDYAGSPHTIYDSVVDVLLWQRNSQSFIHRSWFLECPQTRAASGVQLESSERCLCSLNLHSLLQVSAFLLGRLRPLTRIRSELAAPLGFQG